MTLTVKPVAGDLVDVNRSSGSFVRTTVKSGKTSVKTQTYEVLVQTNSWSQCELSSPVTVELPTYSSHQQSLNWSDWFRFLFIQITGCLNQE